MKIGIFGESFLPIYDGVGRVMEAYANVLSKRGHEVYVIVPQYNTGYKGGLPYEIIDYTAVRFTHRLFYKIGFDVLDPHFMTRLSEIDLDIIHVHGPAFSGVMGMRIAHKRGIPCVGTFHTKFYDDVYHFTKSTSIAKVSAKYVGKFFSRCDEAWAVSHGAADTLKEYGCRPDNIVVMPNGTNRHTLKMEMVDGVAEKYGIRRDVPVLLFVGRINWEKNLGKILESCSLLKKDGLEFQLVFVGTGPHDKPVKELAERLDLNDRFNMTGYVGDLDTLNCLYYLSTLFIFPSVYDTSALVLREAAGMHTAGLVVEGSCAAEVVVNMENGILAKNDVDDIHEKVKEFLSLPKERIKEIEENAYNTIPIPWDGPLMDDVIKRYEALVEKNKDKKKFKLKDKK